MSREYVLDCCEMYERDAAHEYMANVLEFPDYYGKNLDALFDCLTEMNECSIVFTNLWALEELGEYGNVLLAVFEEAETVNDDLTLVYFDEDDDEEELIDEEESIDED